jgi:hypothetical protein
MQDSVMFFGMTRPTKSLQIRQFIVVPVDVFVVDYQKPGRFTAFTRIFTKLPISLNTASPHRILITRVVKFFSISSIVAKFGAIFREGFSRFNISLSFLKSFTAKGTIQFNQGSFIMRNVSFDERLPAHANSISTYGRCVNGAKKMASMAAAGRRRASK